MNKIDLITNIFKFVIITGRTQLFQDDVSEPTIGKIKQNSNLSKRLKYERIYVSPFSEYEIQTYLANKFTVGTENYRKAIQIVNKGNDLMSRPMIRKHSVNHVFLSPTSIINFTSKKQSYDDTRRSSRDNELLQRAQSDL